MRQCNTKLCQCQCQCYVNKSRAQAVIFMIIIINNHVHDGFYSYYWSMSHCSLWCADSNSRGHESYQFQTCCRKIFRDTSLVSNSAKSFQHTDIISMTHFGSLQLSTSSSHEVHSATFFAIQDEIRNANDLLLGLVRYTIIMCKNGNQFLLPVQLK